MVLTIPQQRDAMLPKIRELMAARNIWAYIVPDNDPHMSEYLPDSYKRREAISGFSGSAGTALITLDGPCLLWTDSRYFLQAAAQLPSETWTLMRSATPGCPTLVDWIVSEVQLREQLSPDGTFSAKVGIDPAVCSAYMYARLVGAIGSDRVLLDSENLVDLVWDGARTARAPRTPARVLPLSVCGVSVKEKVAQVLSAVCMADVDGLIVCDLNEVGWLLNIRGGDVPCVPVVYSFAAVYRSPAGAPVLELFVDKEVFPESARNDLAAQVDGVTVSIFPYEAAYTRIGKVAKERNLLLPRSQANMRLVSSLGENVTHGASPIGSLMSLKNPVELEGFAKAHLKNAVAAAKLFAWLDALKGTTVTEYDVVEKLEELSRQDPDYMGPSFDTIAGFGPNSAVVHYEPEKASAARMDKQGLLLLDFGGHYACGGTTDTTRTVFFGAGAEAAAPSEEERRCFTTVLRGHIAIARASFEDGTNGSVLDALCRGFMLDQGLNYGHGTGHGIGTLLSVHEVPYYRASFNFVKDQVITIEPGVYFEGKFGIRIENVGIIRPDPEKEGNVRFDIITRTPLDLSLVDPALLTPEERTWVNEFSRSCRESLAPFLADDQLTMTWVLKNTREI